MEEVKNWGSMAGRYEYIRFKKRSLSLAIN
jgi:hypothetical protein